MSKDIASFNKQVAATLGEEMDRLILDNPTAWQQPVRDAFAAWRPVRAVTLEPSCESVHIDFGGHPDGLYASFNAVYGDPVKYTVYKDNEILYQGEDYLAARNAATSPTSNKPSWWGHFYEPDPDGVVEEIAQ